MGVAERPAYVVPRVAFILEFADFVGVDPGCFGITITSRMAGRDALGTLPGFRWAGDQYRPVPPKVMGLRQDVDWESRLGDGRGWAWGGVGAWKSSPRRRPYGAGIKHVLVEIPTPSRWSKSKVSEFMELVDRERQPWWRRFKDWVEVVSLQDLDRDRNALVLGSADAWRWDGKTARHISRPVTATLRSVVDMNLLRQRDLGRIGDLVGTDVKPPSMHLLLRDARHALHNERFRIAVLDAATSGELALHSLLENRLTGMDTAAAGALTATAKEWGDSCDCWADWASFFRRACSAISSTCAMRRSTAALSRKENRPGPALTSRSSSSTRSLHAPS